MNLFFFQIWLKELNFSFWKKTQFIKKCLKELFSMTQKDLIFLWLKELNPFLFDSKNWTFFKYDAKNWTLFLWIWRNVLNPFSWNMTQSIEPFFFEYDAKYWTLFLRIWRKVLNFFLFDAKNWTFYLPQRIEPFSQYDSKNWTIF